MFKIGDFARINKVSIKTLHHYDDLGILQPEKTDINTRYRYYGADQMAKLNQILALKEAGFSLAEIADIFKRKTAKSHLILLLERKAEMLEESARIEQQRIARLRTNIFLIKNGGIPIMNEITIKQVEPILVASLRTTIPDFSRMGDLWKVLNGFIDNAGIKKTIPCMTLYHNGWDAGSNWDIEVIEPVVKPFTGNDRIKVYELDKVRRMACIVHIGPFETIIDTYRFIAEWKKGNGYEISGPVREIYHKGDWITNNPEEYVTEIQFPLKN